MIIHLRDNEHNRSFNYRAAALIVHDGYVMLHRNHYDKFWAMPGGRVEIGERAAQTAVREVREELGAVVTVDRLLFVIEDYFEYNGRNHHELGMYFLTHLTEASPFLNKDREYIGVEDDQQDAVKLIFRWAKLDELNNLDMPLMPPPLVGYLAEGLTESVQHIALNSVRRG